MLQPPINPSRYVELAVVEDDAEDIGPGIFEPFFGALGHFPSRSLSLCNKHYTIDFRREGNSVIISIDRRRREKYPVRLFLHLRDKGADACRFKEGAWIGNRLPRRHREEPFRVGPVYGGSKVALPRE